MYINYSYCIPLGSEWCEKNFDIQFLKVLTKTELIVNVVVAIKIA